jgi:hypothetical protein
VLLGAGTVPEGTLVLDGDTDIGVLLGAPGVAVLEGRCGVDVTLAVLVLVACAKEVAVAVLVPVACAVETGTVVDVA